MRPVRRVAELGSLGDSTRMGTIPVASHRFRDLLEADASRTVRISFRDGDVFRFCSCSVVDPSIYSVPDQWTAVVVEPIAGRHPDFRRLFHSGSGMDFIESDIVEIFDETAGEIVYVA
jgi:hypothetical protein